MLHPWKKLIEEIRNRNWTQKQFAVFVWKKNSEVNELIKWKRNITIQWDLILSEVFWTPEKYWINMQTDYDYEIAKKERERQKMEKKQEFEVVTDIEQDKTSEKKLSEIEVAPEKESETKDISENILASLPENKEEIVDQPNQELEKQEKVDIPQDISFESEDLNEEEKQKKKETQKIFLNF